MDRPAPETYQPPLTWWGQTWRVLLTLAISAMVWVAAAEAQIEQMPLLFYIDLLVGLAAYVLMFFRRRWPLAIALVTNVMGAVSGTAQGPATLTSVSLATRRRWLHVIVVALVALATSTVYTETQPSANNDPAWISFLAAVFAISASMAWGMYIGSRRELIWTLRNRAEQAEAEQELRVAQSRSTERARIAREMHDVLAHRISQISMHAGALSFREDLSADEMRESVAVIRDRAHEALTDLRSVLGVLRDDETGEPMSTPQPTYADVPLLVDDARAAGMPVTLADDLACDQPMPDVVGRTLYRIVQEGITNARKHAPGARLTITVTGGPEDGVDVTLRNPLGFGTSTTPGAGLGLVGLTERAILRGGRLEHRTDHGAFELHAWIPWAA
ncbi:two-component sensor histidine kinase [Nocardioides szechwanensis]|uniref:histidine kinase n=1 Tax=Nocardioides szechwanensis TaxID=1005944 RepID=A0A1H0K118_9ACTN|nr:histidine kinase [Nocardioides szechwanensis]GEP35371.1 two-component sensor histidine kinase [Nocardioides szechwanensis]SDO49432.1 Signal transduction histidine kinase [Nocardioides szechwanensis]